MITYSRDTLRECSRRPPAGDAVARSFLDQAGRCFARNVLVLVLGPEVLELEQDPLRVVEGLHPRVAQTRELLAKCLIRPHVNEGVGHAVLDAREHCEVVRSDNGERVRRERLQGVERLLQEILSFVVVLAHREEARVAAAALRVAHRVPELLVALACLREERLRLLCEAIVAVNV